MAGKSACRVLGHEDGYARSADEICKPSSRGGYEGFLNFG